MLPSGREVVALCPMGVIESWLGDAWWLDAVYW